jgi:hypothetical protein
MPIIALFGVILMLAACAGPIGTDKSDHQASVSSHTPGTLDARPFAMPLPGDSSRVTKKPFGIHVTPSSSPVRPERFSGYHTGMDFETTPAEQDIALTVSAICPGTVLFANWVNGYGGVLVQACTVRGQSVTVLYGHLSASSITKKKGEEIASAGTAIGVLGKGYGTETDGERKHLHLAVHAGSDIDFRGYVQSKEALGAWIDPALLLR